MTAAIGRSSVVYVIWQSLHLRLLQTEAVFIRGLELVTDVSFAEQFMQIMSIYCHNAIENASGYHADKNITPDYVRGNTAIQLIWVTAYEYVSWSSALRLAKSRLVRSPVESCLVLIEFLYPYPHISISKTKCQ